MIKKILVLMFLTSFMLPVFAQEEEINLTPSKQYSGITNSSKYNYPELYRTKSENELKFNENNRDVVSAKKVLKENPGISKSAPMTYGNFPQNYDSSNSMMMMQGGMQGMMNQFYY